MKYFRPILALLVFTTPALPVHAEDLDDEVAELRQLLTEMQRDYDSRISDLEARLAKAERQARGAERSADDAIELAEQTAIDQTSGATSLNAFNPAIGSVFVAGYSNVDPGWTAIPGFIPGGELGPGGAGFSLGESDFNLQANIDSNFYGNLTLAIASEDGESELELEEVWIQTTSLPSGFMLTAGRFFSEAGYLNKFHRHADDFSDRPLPYQAFFGGQYVEDGLQLRWVAPTFLLIELGTELNWGEGFPATANNETSPGAYTLFTNVGGDIGLSNSWQVGLSWLSADVIDRESGTPGESFSGNSDLATIDFVWKWAPDGNSTQRNVKVQAEYFHRSEDGTFAGMLYDGSQTGWYAQGIWQFMQRWRAGYRHDVVDADNGPLFAGTILEDPGRASRRDSLMLDWSLSEFSRLRLQYIDDQVLSQSDQQWSIQYIMSLGAHGAHEF